MFTDIRSTKDFLPSFSLFKLYNPSTHGKSNQQFPQITHFCH